MSKQDEAVRLLAMVREARREIAAEISMASDPEGEDQFEKGALSAYNYALSHLPTDGELRAALASLPAAAPEQDEAVRQAIGIVESSRQTHVHWAEWRRGGGTGDDMAGDLAHHEEAIKGYDFVLSVLRAALASPPPDVVEQKAFIEGWYAGRRWRPGEQR